ncbi:hypothetical protein [Streptomyces sp. NPDC007100]|uniref:hypothetical protein n=1 Tax=Streptomyces sp. NPDC007100 TaxID=3155602 RepID=UPI0033CEBB65
MAGRLSDQSTARPVNWSAGYREGADKEDHVEHHGRNRDAHHKKNSFYYVLCGAVVAGGPRGALAVTLVSSHEAILLLTAAGGPSVDVLIRDGHVLRAPARDSPEAARTQVVSSAQEAHEAAGTATDSQAGSTGSRLTGSGIMANSALWVGILTALTALASSYLTGRATLRAGLAQARTAATAQALREQRDRRRSAYREMMNCVHAFNVVTWQILEADAARDRESKDRILTRMYEDIGPAVGDMNRANHEVRLDGPAEVSAEAERVRQLARHLQPLLKALIGDGSPDRRRDYDDAYRQFREAYVTFIGLAREALEIRDEGR